MILNGWELGGGSIRIHDRDTQAKVFRLLGMSDEEAKRPLRLLPRGAGVRHAAARRPRARARPHLRAAGRRVVDPGGHRVPEDHRGRGPHGRRAVEGGSAPAARTADQAAGLTPPGAGCYDPLGYKSLMIKEIRESAAPMRKIALPEARHRNAARGLRRKPPPSRIAAERPDSDAGQRAHRRRQARRHRQGRRGWSSRLRR